MESEGCKVLWGRSEANLQLRYTTFVGDGDSSAYRVVQQEQPYGPNIEIVKKDCVGHIQKRMGTGLRNLVASYKGRKLSDGKGIGGRHRLTKKRIDSFQVYYGKAIRDNKGNVQEAKKAVQAILHHSMSTDDKPSHDYCPVGENSWCGWQKDKAKETVTYQHKDPLPEAVATVLRPLFDRLSEPNLLESAIDGFTQNANESLHHLLWDFCPKMLFCSSTIVAIAAGLAVIQFNKGALSISRVLKEMGINPGAHCMAALYRQDKERIYHARIKSTSATKIQRKRRKGLQDTIEEREGVQYASGEFLASTSLHDDVLHTYPSVAPRKCSKCHGPMKGHKRGQPCPTSQSN